MALLFFMCRQPRLTLLALLLAAAAASQAQMAPLPLDENTLRNAVSQHVAAAAGDTVSRFDVRLGSLEPLATLGPCRRAEPFVPISSRPWGRLSVGVRCIDGGSASVLIPVTVAAWGRVQVAAAALPAGTVLGAQDVQEQEAELTREPPGVMRDAQPLMGRTLMRALMAGQPVRLDMTRITTVVQAGDPVRLRMGGAGYAVTASGQALNAAGEGQPVRVRTDLGKVLTGVAREGRQVDISL